VVGPIVALNKEFDYLILPKSPHELIFKFLGKILCLISSSNVTRQMSLESHLNSEYWGSYGSNTKQGLVQD